MKVDLYRYDEKWERAASDALDAFFDINRGALLDMVLSDPTKVNTIELHNILHSKQDTAVIDLRQPGDFKNFQLPGSVNMPFVNPSTPGPFSDSKTLESLWQRLEETFKSPSQEIQSLLCDKRILLTCYDGDSARVATSVLRANGYEADSIRGGFMALSKMRQNSNKTTIDGSRENSPWVELPHESFGISSTPSAPVSL